MASVKAFIRVSSKKKKYVNIRFRYTDGRDIQLFHTSEIMIDPFSFDAEKECVKAKIVFDSRERQILDREINKRKDLIKELCLDAKEDHPLTSKWLDEAIDNILHPEKYGNIKKPMSFFEVFNDFLSNHKLSLGRKRHFDVLVRALKRYEIYNHITLTLHNFSPERIRDFADFLKSEHEIFSSRPELYKIVPESRTPKPRGPNTVNGLLVKLRTFFIWAVTHERTENNPFKKYSIEESVYGTPYFITVEERNALYKTNLSYSLFLEQQRDIFVLQCLIGCRVSDLYMLTRENVINGAIEYIARKTKDGHPVTVRVPLNAVANEILKKYSDYQGGSLFPFARQQDYNDAIKSVFTAAGITRPVLVLDPLTREMIVQPINKIASSHLARRCFVGNLYKQVKDPNLVSSLSGHKEGSSAFARYRNIDDEIKKELVKMLE